MRKYHQVCFVPNYNPKSDRKKVVVYFVKDFDTAEEAKAFRDKWNEKFDFKPAPSSFPRDRPCFIYANNPIVSYGKVYY